MPDKDDKNSGKTSKPGEYERDSKEVETIEDGHKMSFKGSEDREAKAPRNNEFKSLKEKEDVEEARSVPASKQG